VATCDLDGPEIGVLFSTGETALTPNSSVVLVTTYELDGPEIGFRFRTGKRALIPNFEPTQPRIKVISGLFL
jgi:hypothetical protein